MPLYDENQKEVEGAKTPEEVEAALETAKQETKEEAEKEFNENLEETQKQTDIETAELQKQLDEANEALEKEKEKDKNFGNLRKSKEQSNDKIVELTETVKKLETTIEEKVTGIKEESQKKELDAAIKSVAGDDKDLSDKIKFHYDKLSGEEDFATRVQSAIVLATGGKAEPVLDGGAVSGAGGNPTPSEEGGKKELSADAKSVAPKLGITDADIEKEKKYRESQKA